MAEYGLGRLYKPDPRDAKFPVKLGSPSTRVWRYWEYDGWWGDQGQTPECVAFAWTHWLEDGPIEQPDPPPIVDPDWLYHQAQLVDEWPGTNYDGTSVRAGAKVLSSKGFISAYHWATTLSEVVETILEQGPMVVGTNWYNDMFDPDPAGFIRVHGSLAGGHAWVLNGCNTEKELFRMKNSWGRSWGSRGAAFITFKDFERLLNEDGEACIASEVSGGAA